MKARRHLVTAALACAAAGTAPRAEAQEVPGYAANHFQPSERGSRWFANDSLEIAGKGRAALGIIGDYSYRSLVNYRDSDGKVFSSIVRNQTIVHPGASFVFADRVRVGVSVPLQLHIDGQDAFIAGRTYRASDEVAVGDVRFGADVRLFGDVTSAIRGSLGAQLFVPSGSPSAYTGDGEPRVAPRFQVAGSKGNIAYAAKVGAMFRGRDETYGRGRIGTEAQAAIAVGFQTENKKLLVGPELFGNTVLSDGAAFHKLTTPLEVLLGLHYAVTDTIRLGAGAGVGLTKGYGAPVARGLLGIEWVPGDAKEEVEKKADAAPAPCASVDSDGDQIPDELDACRLLPGAHSPDARLNGCPPDADGDGIYDHEDACPSVKGVKTDDPKTTGCADADHDGVVDLDDACPDKPGIRTKDPKTNGCDPDRDHDGLIGDADACPEEPGKPDADPKKSGCPMATLKNDRIDVAGQIQFKTGSSEIVGKESDEVLAAVLTVLKAHPEIKKLRVEGHTDNKGTPGNNKRLSQGRADAVMRWLKQNGIEATRLSAEGFGDTRPLGPNTTEDGRAQNRRVEFHVEEGAK